MSDFINILVERNLEKEELLSDLQQKPSQCSFRR